MDLNVGSGDRAWRITIAFGLLVLTLDLFAFTAGTRWAWLSAATAGLATLLAVTGLSGTCPLYAALGIHTDRPHLPAP